MRFGKESHALDEIVMVELENAWNQVGTMRHTVLSENCVADFKVRNSWQ